MTASLEAKTVNIVIQGFIDHQNVDEFGKTAYHFIKRAEKKGEKVYFGSPKKYYFANENVNYQDIKTVKDVKKLMQAVKKDLGPNDQVNLLVNGHGFSTKNERRPENTGLVLDKEKLTHKKLGDLIWDNIPFFTKVKMIAPYCFSGGIHTIAFDRPRTCSVSATDFRTPSYGEGDIFSGGTTTAFGSKRSLLIRKNPNMSFEESFQRTAEKDFLNDQRGTTSSMAYLKKLLGEGAYKKRQSWWERMTDYHAPYTKGANPIKELCKDFDKDDYLIGKKVTPFIKQVQTIVERSEFEDIFSDASIPDFVIKRYRDIWNRYKDNFPAFLKKYNDQRSSYEMMIPSFTRGEDGSLVEVSQLPWNQAQMVNEFQNEVRQSFSHLLYLYKIKNDLRLIKRLYNEKDRFDIGVFERLVECENGQL